MSPDFGHVSLPSHLKYTEISKGTEDLTNIDASKEDRMIISLAGKNQHCPSRRSSTN